MNIVLMGFDFACPNKGCEALSYAFVEMLNRIYEKEKLKIFVVTYKETLGLIPQQYEHIEFERVRIAFKNPNYFRKLRDIMKNADVIFDITYGDSFADIYGKSWLLKTSLNKEFALHSKRPFVMLPQTYGPFKNKMLRKLSFDIINSCKHAYSRDQLSIDFLKDNNVDGVKLSTDLAFALPYDKQLYQMQSDRIKVGLNASAMLWKDQADNNGKNFGLSIDYHQYCRKLIQHLQNTNAYEIHLIPHVINGDDISDKDEVTCELLHREFPETIVAPYFESPIQAKSYISNMDVFIGARMHATIAAFSTGVATIPFSYSRKFEGLYGRLNYPFVVAGKTDSTEHALAITCDWINDRSKLCIASKKAMDDISVYLNDLENDLINIK